MSRETITVSVIVATYNRIGCIKRAIRELKEQREEGIEIICIDDGSTDGTYEEGIKEIGGDERFIVKRLKENKGPSVARNEGLKWARGEYIGFYDTDDEIPENYYEDLYRAGKESGADIVYTNYNETEHREGEGKFSILKNGAVWDKIYRRELIEGNKIRFLEGRYTADNLFNVEAFIKAKKIKRIREPRYRYEMREDSIGRDCEKEGKRKEDILAVEEKIIEVAEREGLKEAEREELRKFVNRSLNSYVRDEEWEKRFEERLNKISEGEGGKEEEKEMGRIRYIWYYIQKKFGMIGREEYQKRKEEYIVSRSALFDGRWYKRMNPDIEEENIKMARHYVKYGWQEGREPSERFSGERYLEENKDVAAAGICPLVHYERYGKKEGRGYRDIKGKWYQEMRGKEEERRGKKHLWDSMRRIWEYPMRIEEECERLSIEIKEMEKEIK